MTTVNGLPAHILLVHAVVVLLPLAALIVAASALWPAVARRLAGPGALLTLGTLALVPLTTGAGEWLEERVEETAALEVHTELGDTALYVALPLAVLALIVWWRERESRSVTVARHTAVTGPGTATRGTRRTFLAPTSAPVGILISVVAVAVALATIYLVYRIGDSGAQASWQGRFTP
ncbi:DUF2231 domain-containing protein [Pseudonocardia abyssalis]|jgi:hypothetical protein|uniref:Uncharacterized protein n=1 Tax=Pseudonocardia abyssalis TaxID=2792008 RepID=A0ABS6UNQ0_9PSEU|nr:DUF2231 domain-containing protein [Pseudonocardia abyssalis]MBW0116035.1 hypothetical protein [Pseudonocardia abyssalis]MBW0133885.1 hypothetical protein [Pseudonocardia abyssalis]